MYGLVLLMLGEWGRRFVEFNLLNKSFVTTQHVLGLTESDVSRRETGLGALVEDNFPLSSTFRCITEGSGFALNSRSSSLIVGFMQRG